MKAPARAFMLFLLTGLGIGWLVGLSRSPVLASVLAALTGLVVALVGAFQARAQTAAPTPPPDGAPTLPTVNPENAWQRLLEIGLMISALVLGAALGAPTGALAREGRLLTLNFTGGRFDAAGAVENEIRFWARVTRQQDIAVAREFYAARLAGRLTPPSMGGSGDNASLFSTGALRTGSPQPRSERGLTAQQRGVICQQLLAERNPDAIREAMDEAGADFREALNGIEPGDDEALLAARDARCAR